MSNLKQSGRSKQIDEVVFADDAIAVLDQVNQKIENLRLDRDDGAMGVQLPPLAVEREIFE